MTNCECEAYMRRGGISGLGIVYRELEDSIIYVRLLSDDLGRFAPKRLSDWHSLCFVWGYSLALLLRVECGDCLSMGGHCIAVAVTVTVHGTNLEITHKQ